jgi:hypothetical protein
VIDVPSQFRKVFFKSSRLYRILIFFLFFCLIFDAITTYFGLFNPIVFEFNAFTSYFIKYLGKEFGLVIWFFVLLFSYVILMYVFDVSKLTLTEIGFGVIFGFRHLLAAVSNLSIVFDINWLKLLSEKIFILWPFALLIYVLVALIEFMLERA